MIHAPPNIRKLIRYGLTLVSAFALFVLSSTAVLAGTINATIGGTFECNSSEYHFVITQTTEAQAPATITVSFTDGSPQVVPLDKVTGGTAHYALPVGSTILTVASATASIEGNWSGNFNLSHAPCPPEIPEVPLAAIYPLIGAATFATGYGIRRVRSRAKASVSA